MANDPISLYVGDERPDWVETIIVNGVKADYSTGYNFNVIIVDLAKDTLYEASGITAGGTDGQVTTVWVGSALEAAGVTATAVAPLQRYTVFLTLTNGSGDDITIERPLIMKWRP